MQKTKKVTRKRQYLIILILPIKMIADRDRVLDELHTAEQTATPTGTTICRGGSEIAAGDDHLSRWI